MTKLSGCKLWLCKSLVNAHLNLYDNGLGFIDFSTLTNPQPSRISSKRFPSDIFAFLNLYLF